MSGGLMSLIAYGSQDLYLTGGYIGLYRGNKWKTLFTEILKDKELFYSAKKIQVKYLRTHLRKADLHEYLGYHLFDDLVQTMIVDEHPNYQNDYILLANETSKK